MRVVDICERGRERLEFLSFLAGKVNNLRPTVSAIPRGEIMDEEEYKPPTRWLVR